MPYNPFDKVIDDLVPEDLERLKTAQVSEGYYVEFKSDFPANPKIGHSIASLANSYGGWYIVGVKTNENHAASQICGFEISRHPDPVAKLREIIKSHIDPVPIFFSRVLHISDQFAVMVVFVPGDQETPFICKDGRIYRRLSDCSDPIPETNRFVLDQLAERGKRIQQEFNAFCKDERVFSGAESEHPWLNVFISPAPLGIVEKWEINSLSTIEKLLELSKSEPDNCPSGERPLMRIPFNTGFPTYESAVLSQVEPSRFAFNSVTAEFFWNGRAKLHVPLFMMDVLKCAEDPQVIERLSEIGANETDFRLLRFFDIGRLFCHLGALIGFYRDWLTKDKMHLDYRFAVTITNAWRLVPFIDNKEWAEHTRKLGLPVIRRDDIRICCDGGFLFSLKEMKKTWLPISKILASAFGLPQELAANAILNYTDKQEPRKTLENVELTECK